MIIVLKNTRLFSENGGGRRKTDNDNSSSDVKRNNKETLKNLALMGLIPASSAGIAGGIAYKVGKEKARETVARGSREYLKARLEEGLQPSKELDYGISDPDKLYKFIKGCKECSRLGPHTEAYILREGTESGKKAAKIAGALGLAGVGTALGIKAYKKRKAKKDEESKNSPKQ